MNSFLKQIREEDEQNIKIEEGILDEIKPYEEESKTGRMKSSPRNVIDYIDGKEVPPQPDARTFNENDILGNVQNEAGE
jgi:hypothetical protein